MTEDFLLCAFFLISIYWLDGLFVKIFFRKGKDKKDE